MLFAHMTVTNYAHRYTWYKVGTASMGTWLPNIAGNHGVRVRNSTATYIGFRVKGFVYRIRGIGHRVWGIGYRV